MVDTADRQPIRGRDAILGVLLHLPQQVRGFHAGLEDVTVQVADDHAHASVELTATATSEDGTIDAREFRVEMIRVHGDWQIASGHAIRVLER